jgi:hypothetical protein
MRIRGRDLADDPPRKRRKPSLSTAEVVDFLEYLAPPSLGSSDRAYGLQVGAMTSNVRSIIVSPMPTFNALSTAASRKQPLLITAAPLITEPLTTIRRDNPIGSKVAYLTEHRINFYALSDSYAAAPGGFDDSLAERLGLAATSALAPTTFEPQFKIAVYVPPNSADKVRDAAAEAGAGRIGNYSHCSFNANGTGTFLPRAGANPTVGAVGKLEKVEEVRIEMIVPQRELQGVIAAILDAHPYEEVAYDVFVVKNPGVLYGRGRVGELPLVVSLETVLAQVQDALEVDSIRLSHRPEFPISNLAVASGVSDGLIWPAIRGGAGALVTGGATLQDRMLADGSTTVLIDVGYSASVAAGLQRLSAQLQTTFASDGVEVLYAN